MRLAAQSGIRFSFLVFVFMLCRPFIYLFEHYIVKEIIEITYLLY